MNKLILRKRLIQKRASLTEEQRRYANQKIRDGFEKIIQKEHFPKEDMLYFYVSIHTEVDTKGIISDLLEKGYRIALPKVTDLQQHEMKFFEIFQMSDLKKGFHGIYEPQNDNQEEICSKGIMVVPGLGFTKKMDRLGYGGGFYDRYFSKMRADILKVAFAFECQIVQNLPVEETDYKIDMIITEDSIYE